MSSAVAVNLRIYANGLERGESPTRGTINGLRHAADQIEKHLRTIKKLRQNRLGGKPPAVFLPLMTKAAGNPFEGTKFLPDMWKPT